MSAAPQRKKMTRLSALLKSPTSPPARSIPHGGLGGNVQVIESDYMMPMDQSGRKGLGVRLSKKKPVPIQVNHLDAIQPSSRTAPVDGFYQDENHQSFWRALQPSMKSGSALAFVLNEYESEQPSNLKTTAYEANNNALADFRRKSSAVDSRVTNRPKLQPRKSPAELQGSSLLPAAAVSPRSNAVFLGTIPDRFRKSSESSESEVSEVSSMSNYSSSLEVDPLRPPSHLHTDSEDTMSERECCAAAAAINRAAMCSPDSEISIIQTINALNAADLIKVMPRLPGKKLVADWLPAMRKELDKYKSLLVLYNEQNEINSRSIQILVDDLRTLLNQLKNAATTSCKHFERAQADIDNNKRTDLEKLHDADEALQVALLECIQTSRQNRIRAQEYTSLRETLYNVVRTLGDCVRNNLARKLYEDEDLTPQVIKVLQEFKQNDEAHFKAYKRTVPAEAYEKLQYQIQDLSGHLGDCQDIIRAQQKAISGSEFNHDKLEKRNTEQTAELVRMVQEASEKDWQIEVLQRENEVLNERIAADRRTASSATVPTIIDENGLATNRVPSEVRSMLSLHKSELEDRESQILQQNEMIKELLLQVNDLSRRSGIPLQSNSSDADQLSPRSSALPSPSSLPIPENSLTEQNRRTAYSDNAHDKDLKKKEKKSKLTVLSFGKSILSPSKSKSSRLSPARTEYSSRSPGKSPHSAIVSPFARSDPGRDESTPMPPPVFSQIQWQKSNRQNTPSRNGHSPRPTPPVSAGHSYPPPPPPKDEYEEDLDRRPSTQTVVNLNHRKSSAAAPVMRSNSNAPLPLRQYQLRADQQSAPGSSDSVPQRERIPSIPTERQDPSIPDKSVFEDDSDAASAFETVVCSSVYESDDGTDSAGINSNNLRRRTRTSLQIRTTRLHMRTDSDDGDDNDYSKNENNNNIGNNPIVARHHEPKYGYGFGYRPEYEHAYGKEDDSSWSAALDNQHKRAF